MKGYEGLVCHPVFCCCNWESYNLLGGQTDSSINLRCDKCLVWMINSEQYIFDYEYLTCLTTVIYILYYMTALLCVMYFAFCTSVT